MNALLRTIAWFFLLGSLLPVGNLQAEIEKTAVVKSLAVILEEIHLVWDETFLAARAGQEGLVSENIQKLERLRDQAGLQYLADYSNELIAQGETRYKRGDRSAAVFYLRMATRLSPGSPRVAFRSLRLVQVTEGLGAVLQAAGAALLGITTHPELQLRFTKAALYPVLWAGTLGLYCAYILLFLFHMPQILRSIAQRLPGPVRGFGAPFATLILLIAPCLAGPVVCLAIWAVLGLVLLPERRWMGFIAGVLIASWGAVIPLTEKLGYWLVNSDVQKLLRTTGGEYGRTDLNALKRLAEQRETDGVAWYVYGQLLKQSGDFSNADAAFVKAEESLGTQSWILAERGTLAFLQRDSQSARELFEAAEKQGMNSGGFYFNRSKVFFDLLDVERSRADLMIARQKDPELVKRLQTLEEAEGLHSQRAVADITLPGYVVLQSALFPVPGLQNRIESVSGALVPGFAPVGLLGVGVVLLLCTFVVHGKGVKRYSTYYRSYKHSFVLYAFMALLPGGIWVRSGRPGLTFMVISLVTLLLFPLLGWPPEISPVIDLVPGFAGLYASFLGLLFLTICYIAYQTSEEKA